MKKLLILLLALLMLPVYGCGQEENHLGETGIYVYYRAEGSSGSAIGKYFYPLQPVADPLHEALNLLMETPKDEQGLRSAFPAGVRIETYSIDRNEISVSLSEGYSGLLPMDQTILKCCLVLTLCELDEVGSVNIYEDGDLMEEGLTSEILLPESMEESDRQVELTLWFPAEDNSCLLAEQRRLTIAQFKPLEEYVLEELFRGPGGSGARSAIPVGTVVNSIRISGGLCTVDMSSEFIANKPEKALEERMNIFALVNTLTELSGVKKVLITVDGKSVKTYRYMRLDQAFERAEELTEDFMEKQNWYLVNMYLLTADSKLIPIPTVVSDLEYPDYAKMAYRALELLSEMSGKWGYSSALPTEVKVISVETSDRICTIELSPELWRVGEPELELAIRAMTATAMDAGGYDGVRIRAGDSMYRNGEVLRKESNWFAD